MKMLGIEASPKVAFYKITSQRYRKCALKKNKRSKCCYTYYAFFNCIIVFEEYFVLQKTYRVVTIGCMRHHLCFCREGTWNGCQRFGGHHIPPTHLHLFFSPFNIFYVVYVLCCLITPSAVCGFVDDLF